MPSEARKRAQAKYAATPRAKTLARERYLRNREKILARNKTPERRAARRAAFLRWYNSPAAIEKRKHHHKTDAAKASHRRHVLKKFYGLTEADYARMLAEQNGGCAICGGANKNGRPLFVDHNHATKKVRQLLCIWCNSVVGHCREDITILTRVAEYLKKHLTSA